MKKTEIEEGVLRRLYLEEGKTETEIGAFFGCSQVCISRHRKNLGIPTISKTFRSSQRVPPLTNRQRQILIGSLLGDGTMRATGEGASFGEGHGEKQSAYTDWKAKELAPFVAYCRWRTYVHSTDGKQHREKKLATREYLQLKEFYDLFYPLPDRKRIFPKNLTEIFSPLSLAVWYLDDGGVTLKGHPQIAFGLDQISLHRALQALRSLGLKTKVYGVQGNQSIHFPKQPMEFKEIVLPHIPECMAYKIPFEKKGGALRRESRKFLPEKALQLYEGGLRKDQIARLYGVGVSTVSHRLRAAGAKIRRSGPYTPQYSLQAAKELLSVSYPPEKWLSLSEEERDLWVTEIYEILRNCPFPAPEKKDTSKIQGILEKVSSAKMSLEDSLTIQPIRWAGISLCSPYFPHRFEASVGTSKSAFEMWHIEHSLKRAIRYQLNVGDPVIPYRVLKALAMQCRTPTIFRPTIARFLYETFCPQGGKVWDPCAGYGGRLLGACAAGVQYVGTDVEERTVLGNRELAKDLGYACEVCQVPAEEFDPGPLDFVFTSPPYFDKERYGGEGQSWVRYDTLEKWISGFLVPILRVSFRSLSAKGFLAINIMDIRKRSEIIPLESILQEEALSLGFGLHQTLYFPISALNKKSPKETVFVFQKKE